MTATSSRRVLIRRIKDRVRSHNRTALTFAFLSAAGAAICWGLLFALAQWLTLLAITIVRGSYASLPPGFPVGFTAIACALIFSAWLDRKVTPNSIPPDERSPREIAMDFMLAIPRMTLAVSANLAARQRLTRDEVVMAAGLMDRVSRERRMSIHELPTEIPEQRERESVLNAMLLIGLLEIQHADNGIWLRVPRTAREVMGLPALE